MEKQKKGVRLEHISKIYTDPKTGKEFYAVQDTTLDIEPGSFVTLLGPSGCGKTTTLRMIAGFESPDEGDIYLGDEAINALTPNKGIRPWCSRATPFCPITMYLTMWPMALRYASSPRRRFMREL